MKHVFPEGWRYNPLVWDSQKKTWSNDLSYCSDKTLSKFGEFKGMDISGALYFGDTRIVDHPRYKAGVEALSQRDGYAVGIFVKHCTPPLVIIDCDSGIDTIIENNNAQHITRYGKDQLLSVCKKLDVNLPQTPVVRGNRERHGYLIFKRNPRIPITSRKIKPYGLQFDVIGNSHEIHWSCGNRALVAGADLLNNPPEIPTKLAAFIMKHREPNSRAVATARARAASDVIDIHDGSLGTMFLNAVLTPVTPDGSAWNQRLFNAACTLAENGVPYMEIQDLIIERCGPETEHDHRAAVASIGSAWRKVTGEAVPQ